MSGMESDGALRPSATNQKVGAGRAAARRQQGRRGLGKWSITSRPHRADEEVVGLDVGARESTEETHEPRVEGVAGAGSRRPVAGRRGRAERRVDTRAAAGATLPLALIEDRLQLRDGRQPPVAVVVEPSRLCAPVPARTVADAGPAVQRREEAREGGPIRRGPTAAPDVRVVHAVQAAAPGDLLLPLEPRLVVGDRAVRVVHEAQGRGRAGRRGRSGRQPTPTTLAFMAAGIAERVREAVSGTVASARPCYADASRAGGTRAVGVTRTRHRRRGRGAIRGNTLRGRGRRPRHDLLDRGTEHLRHADVDLFGPKLIDQFGRDRGKPPGPLRAVVVRAFLRGDLVTLEVPYRVPRGSARFATGPVGGDAGLLRWGAEKLRHQLEDHLPTELVVGLHLRHDRATRDLVALEVVVLGVELGERRGGERDHENAVPERPGSSLGYHAKSLPS